MGMDDTDNIGMPTEKIYRVDKKRGKIIVIDCKPRANEECEEVSREECEKGTEEYDRAEKEIEQVEEAAEEIKEDKTKTL
jgi:hypothetical protein